MKKTGKRLGALLLALVMIVSLVPGTALAARVEDDAVQIAAPETAVHEARPAGAVDAEDVPAVLAEGEVELLSTSSAVYVSGAVPAGTDGASAKTAILTDDDNRWISNDMKTTSPNALIDGAVSWLVVDLGENVESISTVTIKYNAKACATAYQVQVAGSDFTPASYEDSNGRTASNADEGIADGTYTGQNAIDNDIWTNLVTIDSTNISQLATTDSPTHTFGEGGTIAFASTATTEGARYLRLYFTQVNSSASAATGVNVKYISVMGTRAEVAEQPEYTRENIDAGLFDVGAAPTKNAEGVWSANYSNPSTGTGTSMNGTVIKATAPSYQNATSGDGIPFLAVDGTSTGNDKWHTSYSSNADKEYLYNNADDRYIQLEIVGDAKDLAALRYIGNDSNGAIKSYRVLVTTDTTINDNTQWTTVASGTWPGNGNWQFARFNEACSAQFVRLYADTAKETEANHYYINAKEIRLVQAVEGAELPPPTEPKYPRKTGEFEPGTYVIYDVATGSNNRVLHNAGTVTNQCQPAASGDNAIVLNEGEVVQLGHASDSWKPTDHLWKIEAVNGGYTIKGVTNQKYLTAADSSGQLKVLAETDSDFEDSTTTFSIEPAEGGYKVSNGSGYLRYSGGWKFDSTAQTVLRFYKETLVEYPNKTITGKVTDGNGRGLEGATVTLGTSDHYKTVQGLSETTDSEGNYSISVFGLSDGTYYVRASMDEYGAKINPTPVGVKESMAEDVSLDVQLTKINKDSAKFAYDMSGSQPTLERVRIDGGKDNNDDTDNDHYYVGLSYANGKMELAFKGKQAETETNDTLRMHRLVKLVGTGVKNGTIEFDATRTGTYNSEGRFGLALRLQGTGGEWIYVGSENSDSDWFHEWWRGGQDQWSSRTAGPVFGKGDTRHFKVTIEDTKISLWIDGIQVINEAAVGGNATKGGVAAPSTAADVGFICGNDVNGVPSEITIDNLYIFREDPTFTVTLGNDPALTAKISDSAGDKDLDNNQAAEGDKIKITAASPAANTVLDAITVKKVVGTTEESDLTAEELAALNIGNPSEGVWTFEMPAFNVSVTGTVRTVVGDVTISGDKKVGKTLTANVAGLTEADENKVSYQWYHLNNEGQTGEEWVACTNEGSATKTKTVSTEDRDKKVKVEVTGKTDNGTYATTVTKTATTTENMLPADAVIDGASFDRTAIHMIKNGTASDTNEDQTVIGGKSVTLELKLTTDPGTLAANQVVEDYNVTWAIAEPSVADIATVAAVSGNNLQGQVTLAEGAGAGSFKVKATLSRTGKTDLIATCTITVTLNATDIQIKKDDTEIDYDEPVVIHANDEDNSVTLVAQILPEGATGTVNWVRADGQADQNMLQVDRTTEGQVTITANNSTEQKLGQVAIWATLGQLGDATAVHKQFTVEVHHKLTSAVTISGTSTIGSTLTANVSGLTVYATPGSDDPNSGKAKLNYAWYALDNETDTVTDGMTPLKTGQGTEGNSYVLTASEHNKYIVVVVSAQLDTANNFFYEGSVTSAASAQVTKKTANPPSGMGSTACSEAGNDGTITKLTPNATYLVQYKGAGETEFTAAENQTADASGVITGLAAGEYKLAFAATDDTAESGYSAVIVVAAYGSTFKAITSYTSDQGNATTERNAVEPGDPVIITVTPATGYQLKAGTLKVYKTDDTETTVNVNENNQFTMPGYDVTITAEFEPIDLTITHDLGEGLSCSLGAAGTDHTHTVKYVTESTTITITAATGYVVPAAAAADTVTKTDGGTLTSDYYEYTANSDRSQATITFPHGITDNLTIKVTSAKRTYSVSYNLTHATVTAPAAGARNATHGEAYSTTIAADSGYSLPEAITVKRGEITLVADTDYTYDASTGAVRIEASATTGALSITADGELIRTPLVSATVTCNHVIEGTSEEAPAHVGDTLSVTVEPAAATATAGYQWQRGASATGTFTDITGKTGQTYVLTADDAGKYIRVVATGKGNYKDTVNSNAIGPVAAKIIVATGISLDQTAATVEFGKTLTLTATVEPEDATDKTVTWTSSNAAVATVAGGVVTGMAPGTATITAADSAGHNDTCSVSVTAAQVGVTLSGTPKVGETLTATITPTGATTRSIHWYRVGAGQDGANETIDNNDQTTYELVAADAGYKIMVIVEGTGNYGGTASATTENPIAGENEDLPTYAITVAATTNGTVTADKEEASEGDTVTLTVTPAAGYVLDALTVTKADNTPVTVTDNTFTMPGQAVTVTATFVEDTTPPDASELDQAIKAAQQLHDSVEVAEKAEDVPSNKKFVTSQDVKDTLAAAIEAAKTAMGAATTQADVDSAKATLAAAVTAFNNACQQGTKKTSGTRPSSSTSTVTNPDGSVTTTTTKPDGTKTQTTEKPDGTKETVETKRDGTVIETTEKPDGTVESVKTQPDGTVVETVVAPDGAKESVMTKPDGTVTETVIDTEGAMTEKVTDLEENVVITVTDPEGEELAKVEIPAEIPEPETKFDDAVDHWAEESINKVAALGLMNGVGDNKYGTESSMTRGALATVLYRLSNGKSGYRVSFNDVEIGQYYTEGVAWAAKAKVVTGYTADIFAPNDTITREQLAVMLCRYAKLIGMDTKADATALDKFVDGDSTGAWAVDGMAWCVANGILQGRGQSNLDPTSKVTRAEVAVMLDRFIELIK